MGALLALTLIQATGMVRCGLTSGLTIASLREETAASPGGHHPSRTGRHAARV